MLSVFGFSRIGVVLGDIYFVDPNPAPGQLGDKLRDLPGLIAQAELPADSVDEKDVRQSRDCTDEIVAATAAMLERVRKGELAYPAEPDESGLARTGWL